MYIWPSDYGLLLQDVKKIIWPLGGAATNLNLLFASLVLMCFTSKVILVSAKVILQEIPKIRVGIDDLQTKLHTSYQMHFWFSKTFIHISVTPNLWSLDIKLAISAYSHTFNMIWSSCHGDPALLDCLAPSNPGRLPGLIWIIFLILAIASPQIYSRCSIGLLWIGHRQLQIVLWTRRPTL